MPTAHVRRAFHNDADAASAARKAVRELRGEVAGERLETLGLLVSEIVTNAVRHSRAGEGSHVALDVIVSDGAVRAEVSDRGTGFEPAPIRSAGDDTPGGWGLFLLDELADLWGVVHDERSGWTRVWFELALDDALAQGGRQNGRVHRLPASVLRSR